MEDRLYLPYKFESPRMDASVPPDQTKPGSFGRLVGVDGRFGGCLHKFYGMREVLDIDGVTDMGGIDAYDGISYFKRVKFQKKDTSTLYDGFVIRWDSQNDNTDEQIDLIYTSDAGSTWAKHAIVAAGNSVTSSLRIDCITSAGFLLVTVDTIGTYTVYWNGAALTTVASGPGAFSATLAAPTENTTTAADSGYHLTGDGRYQIAYRFYSSTRGVYSALSTPLTVDLDHYKVTKAKGTINFLSGGDNSGLMVEGDVFTINSRTYEYISSGSDVTIAAASAATIASHCQALADAINGDGSAVVSAEAFATSVQIEADSRGTTGNSYGLVVTTGGNDFSVSGATLDGGGESTNEPQETSSITIDFPAHASVVSGSDYDDFAALFDTVDVFRTINLGDNVSTQGAIFYLETTIAKTGNWATSGTWDSLTVKVGSKVDDALPFQTMYDPEKDVVTTPPAGGAIGRYADTTFIAQASSVDGGYDTLHSSLKSTSPEYFSTYNRRKGDPEDGRPLRFIPAGDSLFQLGYNAIVHIYKSGEKRPLQYTRLHRRRGITSPGAAHSSGNSIFMVSGLGLVVLNATDGSMGSISAADRIIFEEWKDNLASIESCYDSLMNCSFFLNPTQNEILCLWHSSRTLSFLEGANFVGASEGPDIANGRNDRAFFVTATGLIVSPDSAEDGSGNMWDLSSSYTLDGTITSGTAKNIMVDSGATFHADMVGALLYMTSGDNAGESQEISAVDVGSKQLTVGSNFSNDIAAGDRYSVSPSPFKARCWALQDESVSPLARWILVGLGLKVGGLDGYSSNDNNQWRVGAYREGAASLEDTTTEIEVTADRGNSAGALNVDGIDVEPYLEQISCGTKFELTAMEAAVAYTDSRDTG